MCWNISEKISEKPPSLKTSNLWISQSGKERSRFNPTQILHGGMFSKEIFTNTPFLRTLIEGDSIFLLIFCMIIVRTFGNSVGFLWKLGCSGKKMVVFSKSSTVTPFFIVKIQPGQCSWSKIKKLEKSMMTFCKVKRNPTKKKIPTKKVILG